MMGDIATLGITIIGVAIVMGIATFISVDISKAINNETITTYSNSSGVIYAGIGMDAMETLSEWFPIIAVVIAGAVVIGLVTLLADVNQNSYKINFDFINKKKEQEHPALQKQRKEYYIEGKELDSNKDRYGGIK
jgi:uncharacterized membrane protein YqgA involved in biofilm formation